MKRRNAMIILVAGVAIAVLSFVWPGGSNSPPLAVNGESARVEIKPYGPDATEASPAYSSSRPFTAASKTQDASLTLAVKSLSSSGNPKDAFTAYSILARCGVARQEERRHQLTKQAERDNERNWLVKAGVVGPDAVRNACGDLSEQDVRNRIVLVERAATAGVPFAALRFAEEGPWGDPTALETRWDDPSVQAWRATAIKLIFLAASKGDVTALNSLQAQYEDGAGLIGERNPELALRYAVAKHSVYEATVGREILGRKVELAKLSDALPPDAALRAQVEGKQLASEILRGKP